MITSATTRFWYFNEIAGQAGNDGHVIHDLIGDLTPNVIPDLIGDLKP